MTFQELLEKPSQTQAEAMLLQAIAALSVQPQFEQMTPGKIFDFLADTSASMGPRPFGHGNFSFPTKHHWWEKADLDLIESSVRQLRFAAELTPGTTYAIPLPGVGEGGRTPEEVYPLLESLPDNVTVILYFYGDK